MKIEIKGKELDLSSVVPMDSGDLEDLDEAGIFDSNGVMRRGPKSMVTFVLHFAKKCDNEIKREDVRAMPYTQMMQAARYLAEHMSGEVSDRKRPT